MRLPEDEQTAGDVQLILTTIRDGGEDLVAARNRTIIDIALDPSRAVKVLAWLAGFVVAAEARLEGDE